MEAFERRLVDEVRRRYDIPLSVTDDEINESNKKTLEYAWARLKWACNQALKELLS